MSNLTTTHSYTAISLYIPIYFSVLSEFTPNSLSFSLSLSFYFNSKSSKGKLWSAINCSISTRDGFGRPIFHNNTPHPTFSISISITLLVQGSSGVLLSSTYQSRTSSKTLIIALQSHPHFYLYLYLYLSLSLLHISLQLS